ncbi:MAG TPA: autotransporter outer membrane beta-barrel domain-containing protein [Pirellulales bacterium]|nr:autotransporter outer membrane beta-barrel domain-containing protein [Pirellulales bacterium]
MAIRNVRGSSRAARRNAPRNLLLAPPRTRKGLLLGSSFAGGALMVLGATLAMPNAAQAACPETYSGSNIFNCTGSTTTADTITPTGNFLINLGEEGPPSGIYTEHTASGNAVTINNSNGSSSVPDINMSAASTITSDTGDGLRYYNSVSGPNSTVTFDINGKIYGGATAYDNSPTTATGDGLHIGNGAAPTAPAQPTSGQRDMHDIGTLNITLGSVSETGSTIQGADDGLFIASEISKQVTITNYGTIIGHGDQPTSSNSGEGIHVSNADHGIGVGTISPNVGVDYRVSGAVTVNNYGTVTGTKNTGTPDPTTPGTGVNISAKGDIIVNNGSKTESGTITGTTGVYAWGGNEAGADISVTNYGHIGGSLGDGVSIQYGDVGTITNHSYHSIIGSQGTAGVNAQNLDQLIFDNRAGLTAGITAGMDGAYINNITGTGHTGQDAVHVLNTESGILAGDGTGLAISNVGSSGAGKDVVIDNYATWSWSEGDHGGGLIVGLNDDGISATGIGGDLIINNQLTWGSTTNLNGVDANIYDSGTESGLLYDFAGGPGNNGIVGSGIFGDTGVYGHNIVGDAKVNNEAGLIFGGDGDGVALSEVGGDVFVNNQNAWRHGDGGLILGDQFGVQIGANDPDGIGGGVYVNNQKGGIFGLEESGVAISNVTGLDSAGDDAVDVDNTHSGVIAGLVNGVTVDNVHGTGSESNDVYIDNSGYWHHGQHAGGLIVGESGAGVSVTATEGDVTIDNSLTMNWGSIGLTGFDPSVDANESGSLLSSWLAETANPAPGAGLTGFSTGIWGGHVGAEGDSIDGHVSIDNSRGVIVGIGNASEGVKFSNVGDGIEIDNTDWHTDPGNIDDYSLILGSGVGIDLANIDGGVDFNNSRGITYSHNSAFLLDGASEGDVTINNSAGIIAGFYGDGIGIQGVDDSVHIANGHDSGGYILGGEAGSAIEIGLASDNLAIGAESADITNGYSWIDSYDEGVTHGGLIAGVGSADHPVIYLSTSEGFDGGATVTNHGIITGLGSMVYDTFNESGADLPGFNFPLMLGQSPGDLQPIYDDVNNIAMFVGGPGSGSGSIDNLSRYNDAAADVAVVGRNGATTINNSYATESGAVIFGTVDLAGVNQNSEGDYVVGNQFNNTGNWFTLGDNIVSGEGADSIHNDGLIQTAFGEGFDYTSFTTDTFYNDEPVGGTGVLSMIDGEAGDVTTIIGNFQGSTSESGFSYLAVDTNFADWNLPNSEGTDQLHVEGDGAGLVSGSTGVIINKLNTEPSEAGIGKTMLLVTDNSETTSCDDRWCMSGDPFFVASQSTDYINVGGAGFVKDGLLMWGIAQTESGVLDDEYSLESTWSPDSGNQPVLMHSIQSASIDTAGVVDDHVYGNSFPDTPQGTDQGGGGADLSQPLATTTTGVHTSSVLWGRAVGSWDNRDTTVTGPALDLDTNANTTTYALQAGVELRPNADGGDGVRLGLYGGYLSTNTAFDTYGGSSKGTGGTVGGYAALVKDGWYIDGEVKADFLGVTYSSTSVSVDTNATTVAVLANTGYRMQNGASFLEPIASFVYANTSLGDTSSGGVSVSYQDGQSIRAGAGVRVGTTLGTAGGTQTQLDLTGRVWDEFGGPNQVVISDGNPADDVTLSDSISGVFGEVVGRATVYNADRTASGFVSVGGKFGSDMSSVEAKVGARKAF